MKKVILFLSVLMLTSCVTMQQKEKWAQEIGYVKPSEVTVPEQPTHELLPHPMLPILDTEDVSTETLMKEIIIMDGSIEKLLYLIEIYEREYVNSSIVYSNQKFKDKTLDELKLEYMNLLGIVNKNNENEKDNSKE